MSVYRIKFVVGGYYSQQDIYEQAKDEIRGTLDSQCDFPQIHQFKDYPDGYSETPVLCKIIYEGEVMDVLRNIYIWTGNAVSRFENKQSNLGIMEINVNGINYDVPEAYHIKKLTEI